jgi:hypothetical protein
MKTELLVLLLAPALVVYVAAVIESLWQGAADRSPAAAVACTPAKPRRAAVVRPNPAVLPRKGPDARRWSVSGPGERPCSPHRWRRLP